MLAALSWRSYQFCAKKLVKLSVNILSFCVKDHTYLPFSFAMLKFILMWSQCKISYAKFALCLVMLIIRTRGHFSVNSIMRREIQNVICETSYVIDELWAWIKRILFKLWRCSSQSWKFLAEIKQSILFLRPPLPFLKRTMTTFDDKLSQECLYIRISGELWQDIGPTLALSNFILFFTAKSVPTYELQGVPLTFFTFRVLITMKICINDLMLARPKCVWVTYINVENCKQRAEKVKYLNVCLSNTFWLYQHRVKSAPFQFYCHLLT